MDTMKKGIWLSLFLWMGLTAFGQAYKVELAVNPDGSVSRGRMENGKRTGLWITYDKQSNPTRFEEFKDGERHGYLVENDEHGHPFMEGWFQNGKPIGKHLVFAHGTRLKEMDFDSSFVREYYETGPLKKSGKIKNGQPDGVVTQYYETGNVLSENTYAEGKKNGLQKYYYQTGKLQAEYQAANDMLSGAYRDFHENGQKSTEGEYRENKKEGTWKEFDENGKLIRQIKYKNDTEVK